MKRAAKIAATSGFAVILFFSILVVFPAASEAKPPVALEGVSFNVSQSASDNLKTYVGKDVIIHLRSGKNFQGYVKSVGDRFLHLEKLAGRDFYDALIRIDDIIAIEAKFRDMK